MLDSVRVPNLEIVAEIGRGAGSVVYQARRDSCLFAVKVASTRLAAAHAEPLQRFRREAALLGCMRHAGLPAVVEVGDVDGRPYIVMEHVPGRTLASVLTEGPLAEEQVIRLGLRLAEALAEVHRHEVVHRDVKPQNIIIGPTGDATLVDFGFARRTTPSAVAGEVAGTFLYCAPEQAGLLRRPIDGRCDLYALGIVLYECITGRPPFFAADVGELTRLHAFVPARPVREVHPSASRALSAIIERLLAKDPDDRYPSGSGLAYDLSRMNALDAEHDAEAPVTRGDDESRITALPLVGRDAELAVLLSAWEEARGERSGVVLVTGETGSGKSRLLQAFSDALPTSPARVLTGRCTRESPMPLSGLREAVEGWMRVHQRSGETPWSDVLELLRARIGGDRVFLQAFSPRLASALSEGSDLAASGARPEDIHGAVSSTLAAIAETDGGLIIIIDDAQWLDDASRHALVRLMMSPVTAPLLVVFALRNDERGASTLTALETDLGDTTLARIALQPLDRPAVEQLASELLRGRLSGPLGAVLEACSHGNPYTLIEYVRALIHEGLLRPSWGRWEMYPKGLETLQLPTDVLALLTRRVRSLSPATLEVLRLAAVIGPRVSLQRLSMCVMGEDATRSGTPQNVYDAVAEGLAEHLLTRIDAGTLTFVHGRARDALLADLPALELKMLHQRVAESLDRPNGDIFELAGHYARGETSHRPQRVYQTGFLAGVRALTMFAYEEAYGFLQTAYDFASQTGMTILVEHEEALGEACARTRRAGEARVHLSAARARTPDLLARARLSARIAHVYLDAVEHRKVRETIVEALKEMEAPRCDPGALAVPRTLGLFAGTLLQTRLGLGAGTAREEERTRCLVLTDLYHMLAGVAYFRMEPLPMIEATLRAVQAGHRAGASRETVLAYGHFAVMLTLLGRPQDGRRTARFAEEMAEQLGDSMALAHTRVFEAVMIHLSGHPLEGAERMMAALDQKGRFLDLKDFVLAATDLAWSFMMRGYFREASTLIDRGLRKGRLTSASVRVSQPMLVLQSYRISLLACQGRVSEAVEILPEVRAQIREREAGPFFSASLLGHLVLFYLEQNDLGEPFEEVVQEFEGLRLDPRRQTLHNSHFYVFIAHARLTQVTSASDNERPVRLRQLREAVRNLRRLPPHPTLRAHATFLEGALAYAEGDRRHAALCLRRAEALAREIDSPWVTADVARLRSAMLTDDGHRNAALREGRVALGLGLQHGWIQRVRALRGRFPLSDGYDDGRASMPRHLRGGTTGTEQAKLERELDAIMQIGLASVKVTDPQRQATVALDEIVRLLSAERAFLFLSEADGGELRLMAARSADGHMLTETSAYSSKVVNEVWATGLPVVVSGSADAELLGSVSAVVHDLRSIVAAPLRFRDLLIGVVYLDSRVARGLFTRQDVDILTVLSNHIAIAIETSRAARLERAVASEREQRKVAERMRTAIAQMSGTLAADEVLDRLLDEVAQQVDIDRAVAALWDETGFEVRSVRGFADPAEVVGARLNPSSNEALNHLLTQGLPVVRDDRPDGAHDPLVGRWRPLGGWLGVPLMARAQTVGVLIVSARAARTLDDRQVEMVHTLTSQAAVALENARLFSQVQRLATTDGLTGLLNRREFFTLAHREVERALRLGRPLSAVMMDVDHFKRFNDTYGHAVGDEVLRVVAACCQRTMRAMDLVGRYGGEEFAVLIPEQSLAATRETSAERLRLIIAETPVATEHGSLSVTVSLGVSTLQAEGDSLAALLKRADAALYVAKAAGRNRVETE